MFMMLRNQKGMALISTYFASMAMIVIASAAWGRSFFEMQAVNREVARVRSFAAAEAGIQNAMAQISLNAYTGYINTTSISVPTFQDTNGNTVGSYSVSFSYPNQADWVVVTSTATVDTETKILEGRIFLDSNLSKYLVYANATTFSSGAGAVYGSATADVNGVSASADDRAALYVTGTWNTTGNVQLYGDVNAGTSITTDGSLNVHGDVYSAGFSQNANGTVASSGVSGSPTIGDGFSDDSDRTGNGTVDSSDYPDYHDLTATGGGDAHATETLTAIDTSFYQTNNNIPSFGGASAVNRYLRFTSTSGSGITTVTEYNSTYTSVLSTTVLPSSAIVYVNGTVSVAGEIGGRVSVVASGSINFDGNVNYSGGQTNASSTNSAAFMAQQKLFLRTDNLNVSGILYAQNASSASVAFDAGYNTSGGSDTSKGTLNLYGNRIMNGATNLSYYGTRNYNYDSNIKYYRPPGIPVVPSLKTVREN